MELGIDSFADKAGLDVFGKGEHYRKEFLLTIRENEVVNWSWKFRPELREHLPGLEKNEDGHLSPEIILMLKLAHPVRW